jgi:hypothetical protein
MIDDGLFVPELLTLFGESEDFRMGRVAEKQRHAAILQHLNDFFDLRFELAVLVEQILADLKRFFPFQRRG